MAHITVETRLAQPAREVTEAKDHTETDHALRELWKSTAALRTALDQDSPLSDLELLLLENRFHVIQTTYYRWNRKQRGLPTE